MNLIAALGQSFPCSKCGSSGDWRMVGTPQKRQNSTISRLGCAICKEQIVAKEVRKNSPPGQIGELRNEFEVLSYLRPIFSPESQYRVLDPLGYTNIGGSEVMLTRYFQGRSLASRRVRMNSVRVSNEYLAAGRWLRKLHLASPGGIVTRTLGIQEKVEYLDNTLRKYGCSKSSRAYGLVRLLRESSSDLENLVLPAARLHGDFKAGNILGDGTQVIGVDIQWRNTGCVVYDLAPFLNHELLESSLLPGFGPSQKAATRRQSFLEGYGYCDNQLALDWVQLYFAIHYFCKLMSRGGLPAIYARLYAWPIAQRLSLRLQGKRLVPKL